MDKRTSTFAILVIVLATTFILETDAKKTSNQTDDCYKPCRVKSLPVCGNDGRNYTTGCHLSVARCRARKIGQRIYPVNTGYCQSSKPVSQCHLNCTQRRVLLCASDGKTYKNPCLFKRAKCEARKRKDPPLTVLSRKGPCSKKASSLCRPYSSCPKIERPVCGSDNKTYQNICHLKGKNCRLKRAAKGKKYKKLTLKYCGACGRGKRCIAAWTQKCPEVKFCDQLLRAAVRYAEAKKAADPNSVKKNGNNQRVPRLRKKKTKKTSTKKMMMKKINMKKTSTGKKSTKKNNKKKNSKKVTLKKLLLKKPSLKTSKKPTPQTSPKTKKKPVKPMKIIPKQMFQVCGSDGETYQSLCHLQVAQCNKVNRCQRLQMKHKGACKKRPGRRT